MFDEMCINHKVNPNNHSTRIGVGSFIHSANNGEIKVDKMMPGYQPSLPPRGRQGLWGTNQNVAIVSYPLR